MTSQKPPETVIVYKTVADMGNGVWVSCCASGLLEVRYSLGNVTWALNSELPLFACKTHHGAALMIELTLRKDPQSVLVLECAGYNPRYYRRILTAPPPPGSSLEQAVSGLTFDLTHNATLRTAVQMPDDQLDPSIVLVDWLKPLKVVQQYANLLYMRDLNAVNQEIV